YRRGTGLSLGRPGARGSGPVVALSSPARRGSEPATMATWACGAGVVEAGSRGPGAGPRTAPIACPGSGPAFPPRGRPRAGPSTRPRGELPRSRRSESIMAPAAPGPAARPAVLQQRRARAPRVDDRRLGPSGRLLAGPVLCGDLVQGPFRNRDVFGGEVGLLDA